MLDVSQTLCFVLRLSFLSVILEFSTVRGLSYILGRQIEGKSSVFTALRSTVRHLLLDDWI